MTLPALAVKNSGWGGRGYKNPVTGDKRVVPSITTVLKSEAKPALVQWGVDQTAGFAVANAHRLMTMSDTSAFKMLRWIPRKEIASVEPGMDLNSYHTGVLSDASEMGTWMHEWIQGDVVPELDYPDTDAAHEVYWDMVTEWGTFASKHEIVPHCTERTVWHDELGYAGTLDGLWEIDGKVTLLDIKTSRGLYSSTWMQLAALRAAPEMFVPQDDDTYASIRDWQLAVEDVAVIHVRPRDWDNQNREMAPFCKLVRPKASLDTYFRGFEALLNYGQAITRDVAAEEKEWEKNAAEQG